MTTLHSKADTKPLLRRIKSRLGIIEPLLGRIEPCFGIIKPVKGLNTKPNLGNVFRIAIKSAATELKTPFIDDRSAKAVVYLCSQSHIKCSKNVNIDLLKSTNESLMSSRATTTCRRFKIAKQMKRSTWGPTAVWIVDEE